MNISVSQQVQMLIETTGQKEVISESISKTDQNSSIPERYEVTIPAAPGADVDLGLTAGTLVGRIAVGKFLIVQSDIPVQLKITTPSETDQTITIRDLIVINGDINKVLVVRSTTQANLIVTAAGI